MSDYILSEVKGSVLLNMASSRKNWLVKDLQIASGRPTLIYGDAGSFKTTVMHSLICSVINGYPVWGRLDVNAGRVVYLDYEMGQYDAGYMLRAHGPLNDNLSYFFAAGFYIEEHAEELYNICRGASLCLIDSLIPALGEKDPNHPASRRCLDLMSSISMSTGCSFIVIHHSNRTGTSMGSLGFTQACGNIYKFSRGKSDDSKHIVTLKHEKSASAKGIQRDMTLGVSLEVGEDDQPTRSLVSINSGVLVQSNYAQLFGSVLVFYSDNYVNRHVTSYTRVQLAEELRIRNIKFKETALNEVISKLEDQGYVNKIKEGKSVNIVMTDVFKEDIESRTAGKMMVN